MCDFGKVAENSGIELSGSYFPGVMSKDVLVSIIGYIGPAIFADEIIQGIYYLITVLFAIGGDLIWGELFIFLTPRPGKRKVIGPTDPSFARDLGHRIREDGRTGSGCVKYTRRTSAWGAKEVNGDFCPGEEICIGSTDRFAMGGMVDPIALGAVILEEGVECGAFLIPSSDVIEADVDVAGLTAVRVVVLVCAICHTDAGEVSVLCPALYIIVVDKDEIGIATSAGNPGVIVRTSESWIESVLTDLRDHVGGVRRVGFEPGIGFVFAVVPKDNVVGAMVVEIEMETLVDGEMSDFEFRNRVLKETVDSGPSAVPVVTMEEENFYGVYIHISSVYSSAKGQPSHQ